MFQPLNLGCPHQGHRHIVRALDCARRSLRGLDRETRQNIGHGIQLPWSAEFRSTASARILTFQIRTIRGPRPRAR